jgi:hypothetical protein
MARSPPAPFVPPQTGSLDQRVNLIAQAMTRKADAVSEPVYSAVLLVSPGGTTYRLSVTAAGALQVDAVART